MSSTLTWRPAITDNASLPNELKFVLRTKFGGNIKDRMFNRYDLGYLDALVDAGIKGADQLIEAIQLHKEVIVTEEY